MRHDLAQEQKHPEEVQKRSNIRPKQIGRLYSLWWIERVKGIWWVAMQSEMNLYLEFEWN